MLKRLFSLLICSVFTLTLFTACGSETATAPEDKEDEKITITATLFPQYDFAKQIAGEKAEVTMLLPRGVESHSFEPTPNDIINITNSDVFIYTGEYMEPWAKKIVDGVDVSTVNVVDASENIMLDTPEEAHDHEAEEAEHEHEGHHHGKDPHIWTSPVNAITMCENITKALVESDPENADYYKQNSQEYIKKLTKLDSDIREVVKTGSRDEIILGGRNPFHYFLEEYGLNCMAAYDSCSSETEPSVKVIADIIKEIEEKEIPVVYYQELVKPTVAESLSEETGAKMLLMHSCHNVSKEEFENGVSYLSIMQKNLENLKVGLN